MAPPLLPRRAVLGALLAAPAASALAQPAAVSSELRGTLDAETSGLRAQKGADRTRQIQALLDEAAATGKMLVLPPGDFLVSTLRLPREARLAGSPGGATRLFGTLGGKDLARLVLRDLVLVGSDASTPLLALAGCRLAEIEDCAFEGSGGQAALDLTAVGGRVSACRIAGARGVALLSRDAAGLRIEGNTVEDCGDGGLLVHRTAPGPDGTILSGNRIARIRANSGGTGQFGNGINVFRAGNVTVADNQVEACAFSAIRSNGGNNVSITGNTCRASGETALYSEFVFEGALIANNIVEGAAIGISIANFNEGGRLAVCANNLVRDLKTGGPYPADPPGFGLGISVEADTTLSGNVVEGAPLYGIKLGWGPYLRNVSATGNLVKDCGVGIAVSAVEGSGRALLSGNIVSGAHKAAIQGFRWSEASTPDLLDDPAAAPAHLTLSGNARG